MVRRSYKLDPGGKYEILLKPGGLAANGVFKCHLMSFNILPTCPVSPCLYLGFSSKNSFRRLSSNKVRDEENSFFLLIGQTCWVKVMFTTQWRTPHHLKKRRRNPLSPHDSSHHSFPCLHNFSEATSAKDRPCRHRMRNCSPSPSLDPRVLTLMFSHKCAAKKEKSQLLVLHVSSRGGTEITSFPWSR